MPMSGQHPFVTRTRLGGHGRAHAEHGTTRSQGARLPQARQSEPAQVGYKHR